MFRNGSILRSAKILSFRLRRRLASFSLLAHAIFIVVCNVFLSRFSARNLPRVNCGCHGALIGYWSLKREGGDSSSCFYFFILFFLFFARARVPLTSTKENEGTILVKRRRV